MADYNTLALSLDLNKLLVPAAPRQEDYLDFEGKEDRDAYEAAKEKYQSTSPISGIFKSFSDAPGGFKEELREINFSIGAEYAYNNQFFLRAGYYNENKYKGNRKYFTFGCRIRTKSTPLRCRLCRSHCTKQPVRSDSPLFTFIRYGWYKRFGRTQKTLIFNRIG